ncbi:hypothetical protein [Arthrobacter sp. RCC_34]|uniref:hypothetical protein n=1 Tax=Arthrobacter sp. RCC_34 TaxID=3239230 RepID=UPI00352508E4
MPNPQLLTARQVADRLHLTLRVVQLRAKKGDIPVAFKSPGITGQYLFDPADVAAIEEAIRA